MIKKKLLCETVTLSYETQQIIVMCILAFAYSKYKIVLCSFRDWCELHVAMETV